MRLIDYTQHILGKEYLGELSKEPYRGSEDMLKRGKELLAIHPTASKNLEKLDSDKIFFAAEVDFARHVASNEREEMFYSLKLGYTSSIIPAKALFLVKRCYDTYGTINLLPGLITKSFSKKLFSKGYIAEGYNLRDVICSIVQENFEPLSEGKYAVPNGLFWDVYIEDDDMVAIIPKELKEVLTNEDLRKLEVVNGDLCISRTPIRELAGFIGVVNSAYDLRELV